jgi:hypothetical protein
MSARWCLGLLYFLFIFGIALMLATTNAERITFVIGGIFCSSVCILLGIDSHNQDKAYDKLSQAKTFENRATHRLTLNCQCAECCSISDEEHRRRNTY